MPHERIELRKAFFKKAVNANRSVTFLAPKRYPQIKDLPNELQPLTVACSACGGSTCGNTCTAHCAHGCGIGDGCTGQGWSR